MGLGRGEREVLGASMAEVCGFVVLGNANSNSKASVGEALLYIVFFFVSGARFNFAGWLPWEIVTSRNQCG